VLGATGDHDAARVLLPVPSVDFDHLPGGGEAAYQAQWERAAQGWDP
jgi:hypothetical protein